MNLPQSAAPGADVRSMARLAFARDASHDPDASIEPASADASARSYWRVRDRHGSSVLMDAPPGSGNLAAWLNIDARLRDAGLNAPDVLAEDRGHGFLLLSDLGSRPYLAALDAASADALYGDALDALLTLQTRVTTQGLPRFDAAFILRELALMPTWFLERHLGVGVGRGQREVLDAAFRCLVDNALAQPQVFMHRDYHSRNLMYVSGHNPGIIDFQDAMLGPVAYDVVSLLRDCYIAWDEARVRGWAEAYRQLLQRAGVLDPRIDGVHWQRWFDLTGLQRHLKVLGIFCRLWYRDGKRGYLGDLPRVWQYVREVASRYPELRDFLTLLEGWVGKRALTEPRP